MTNPLAVAIAALILLTRTSVLAQTPHHAPAPGIESLWWVLPALLLAAAAVWYYNRRRRRR